MTPPFDQESRTLSDADVKAIVGELKTELAKDFQLEVGRGVIVWCKKAIFLLMILIAIYGAAHEAGYISTIQAPHP